MSINFAEIRKKAETLLNDFDVVNAPVDPQRLAEGLGLTVSYLYFDESIKDKLWGFIDLDNNRIVVNECIKNNEKLFTIAHELGHYSLHKEWAACDENYSVLTFQKYETLKPQKEQEADAFASYLLIPRDILLRYKDVASTKELARLFCVSEDQILTALKSFL